MIVIGVAIAIRLLIFLRSTRRRNFPLGFLCANMELAYLGKGSSAIIPFLCIRANSLIQQLGLLSGGLVLVDFGCIQHCCLSELVQPCWIASSSQNPSCGWRKGHDSWPEDLQLLFFSVSVRSVSVQSNRLSIFSGILCSLVNWVFLSLGVQSFFGGFVSVLLCDLRIFQNFQA